MEKSILIVAATNLELKPLVCNRDFKILTDGNLKRVTLENKKIDILITTMGMVSTTFHLAKTLNNSKYDFVINAGICGAFETTLHLGDVVHVTEETFAELAIETEDGLVPIKLGSALSDKMLATSIINQNRIKIPQLDNLKEAKGITVNTITGSRKRMDYFRKMYAPDVESMEGGAFLYVCNAFKQPCTQIRTISNYVGNLNRNDWNIELAINNLAVAVLDVIKEL